MPSFRTDLQLARHILQTNEMNYKVVAVKEGRFLGGQHGEGIVPLLTLVEQLGANLAGASVADRVVGLAVAYVVVLQRVKAVHGDVCSGGAVTLLSEHGIQTSSNNNVPYIMGRDGSGRCVMEQQVLPARDASDAVRRIQQFLNANEPPHHTVTG